MTFSILFATLIFIQSSDVLTVFGPILPRYCPDPNQLHQTFPLRCHRAGADPDRFPPFYETNGQIFGILKSPRP